MKEVDIITAVYRNHDVVNAISSLQSQIEVIQSHVVVDGSRSAEFSESLAKTLSSDARHIVERDSGIYDALNKGLRNGTAPIIGVLHSDDVFADRNVLRDIVRCFSETAADVVYGDLVYVSQNRTVRHWRAGPLRRAKIGSGWMPPHPTVFLRREVADRIGPYNTRFRIAGDYEYLLRLMLEHDLKIVYLPRVITKMKVGGASNGSLGRLFRKSIEDVWAMRMHGVNPYIALPLKVLSKLPQFLGGHRLFSGLLRIR